MKKNEKHFRITAQDNTTSARTGIIQTQHGRIETPAFAPVASQGSIKSLTHSQVKDLGAQIILVNAYHLFLRPGTETIQHLGGVHTFISWDRPILSDSGGYQIYSLANLVKVKEDGVEFSSHLDGTKSFVSPEDVIKIQQDLGTDIMMPLDNFPPYPSSPDRIRESVELTTQWAARSRKFFLENTHNQHLWGICQGSVNWDIRKKSIEDLLQIDFDGYALGGLGIGEPKEQFMETIEKSCSLLPHDKPRYLMGMGYIQDILEAVDKGVDFFDCVLPTRNARNGTLFTSSGKLIIKNQKYTKDEKPIDENCSCYTCLHFSRAYLRHLYERNEMTSATLNTIHNLHFYLDIFQKIRQAIQSKSYVDFKRTLLNRNKEKIECY
ncbi:tRNA guanosine(34) transglycosylase Tgt [Acidobacteriota bacterium]